ncbi:MAG: hypothetical protein K2X27_28345 [Candidatus Obscuribacterales bacterium]|nr:hypothetical protein [Candidatus Obscuribacterales bacterium]
MAQLVVLALISSFAGVLGGIYWAQRLLLRKRDAKLSEKNGAFVRLAAISTDSSPEPESPQVLPKMRKQKASLKASGSFVTLDILTNLGQDG